MLSKFMMRAAITAAALTCTTSSASAEQFEILMMENAFFPEVSYLRPGDEVIFINQSGRTLNVAAEDGSWEVATVSDGMQASLMIIEGMPNQFGALVPNGDAPSKVLGIMNFSVQQPVD
jgi:plastocyanin